MLLNPSAGSLAVRSSRALGSKGEGATQNTPGTHTGSEMLGTAFWVACSTTLKKFPNTGGQGTYQFTLWLLLH